MAIDPKTALAFAIAENPGVYAMLLGSGLSRAAQIPTGWEITLDIVRKIARSDNVADQADWAQWYFDAKGKPPEYSELLSQLSMSAHERRAILHRYIEPTSDDIQNGRKVPTKAHRAIARLVARGLVRVLITTNFDRLLESALRDEGIEPTVVASADDIKGAVPLIHSRCYVVKVNGDYLDTRIRNTERELAKYSPQMNRLLDRIFDEHGLLVCGWSAEWDIGLRDAIARTPNRRFPMYWASRGSTTAAAKDLVALRAGVSLTIQDADTFFVVLENHISALIDLRVPDPRSADLIVGNVKRLLRDPDGAVELEALLKAELERLASIVKSEDFQQLPQLSTEEFARRIARYESATESLARVFGILGYWGQHREDGLIARIITSLATLEGENGLVMISGLRMYPALLLMYAFGLGRLASGRFDGLYGAIGAKVRSAFHSEPKALVSLIFLDSWMACERSFWWSLPEFSGARRVSPVSHHLHRIFSTWSRDYVVISTEFDQIFDEFELLCSLASLSNKIDKTTLLKLQESADIGYGNWVPIGRIAWNSERRRAILERWGREPWRVILYRSGFVPDVEYLLAGIVHLERLSQLVMSGA